MQDGTRDPERGRQLFHWKIELLAQCFELAETETGLDLWSNSSRRRIWFFAANLSRHRSFPGGARLRCAFHGKHGFNSNGTRQSQKSAAFHRAAQPSVRRKWIAAGRSGVDASDL
jgi:hypothetical protein